jgi:hypothetical protein
MLNSDDPWFPWDHAFAHRNALGVMSPLDRFSSIPYFIDPMQDIATPGSMWHLDHQSAHNDALANLPTEFGASTVGLFIGQNLRDTDLDDPRQRLWWTFQNHMEHYVGGNTITPNVQFPPPAPQWVYPFW